MDKSRQQLYKHKGKDQEVNILETLKKLVKTARKVRAMLLSYFATQAFCINFLYIQSSYKCNFIALFLSLTALTILASFKLII